VALLTSHAAATHTPRHSRKSLAQAARAIALVVAVGLGPLAVGSYAMRDAANDHAKQAGETRDKELLADAEERVTGLNDYFERARDVVLLTAQNPAFADFYREPGTREEKARRGGPTLERVHRALGYLERLYPSRIGEACFIDESGWENARVVRGTRAAFADLGNEIGNPFVKPSFALPIGQVYQARPYVSPDTREWVISNSTPLRGRDGSKPAIVHFEVTIESFRRAIAPEHGRRVYVVDARSGSIIVDSSLPQRIGTRLGRPADRRFAALSTGPSSGVSTVNGNRIGFHAIKQTPGNQNHWIVVVESERAAAAGGFGLKHFTLLALLVLLIGFAIARRWVRVNTDLAESKAELQVLFQEAEESRHQLSTQNEQLLELDRLKDEFVALVSHELRTPLTSIRGYLELVLEGQAGALNDDQDQFLRVVERNAGRLQRLVGDLLFIAQVDAGRLTIEPGDVDLNQVAEESLQAAAPAAAENDVTLRLDADAQVVLPGDRARIAQLLDNFVSNAIKFTPPGGSVDVRIRATEREAVLEVADTGLGISKPEQERLFERFFRTSAATTNAVPGTGLGLAISKAIVEAHNGAIDFESEEGIGTTFRVALPRAEQTMKEAA
jgi:signal transduction histidine kinase